MLGPCLDFDLSPHRGWQSDRAHHRFSALSLARVASPKKDGVRPHFRHFPEREERGAASLAAAGEGIPTYRAESLEVDFAFERVSRFRNVSFHSWLPLRSDRISPRLPLRPRRSRPALCL
jgi:hypothetical protein